MGKGTKSIAFYLMMILVFGSLMYFIVKEGESQQVGTAVQTMQNAPQTMGEGFLVLGFGYSPYPVVDGNPSSANYYHINCLPLVRLDVSKDRPTHRHR